MLSICTNSGVIPAMGRLVGIWVWGPPAFSLPCQRDLSAAQIYDLLLKVYRRHELPSSVVAFLWGLFELEIFLLHTFPLEEQHHILLQRGSIRLKNYCAVNMLSQ